MKCTTNGCDKEAVSRGLCWNCYKGAYGYVKNGKATWEELENAGYCKPSHKTKGCGKLIKKILSNQVEMVNKDEMMALRRIDCDRLNEELSRRPGVKMFVPFSIYNDVAELFCNTAMQNKQEVVDSLKIQDRIFISTPDGAQNHYLEALMRGEQPPPPPEAPASLLVERSPWDDSDVQFSPEQREAVQQKVAERVGWVDLTPPSPEMVDAAIPDMELVEKAKEAARNGEDKTISEIIEEVEQRNKDMMQDVKDNAIRIVEEARQAQPSNAAFPQLNAAIQKQPWEK